MNALLAALPDAVAVEAADGLLVGCNRAFERLAGAAEADLAGRGFAELLAGLRARADLLVSSSEGPEGRVHVLRRLEPWAGPASAVDAEPEDAPLGEAWTAGAVREALSGESAERVASTLVALGARTVPGSDCLLALVPVENPASFQVVAGQGSWAAARRGQRFRREGSLAGRAMESRSIVESGAAETESALGAVLREGGIQTARIVPMLTSAPLPDGRTALGMIAFYRSRPGGFEPAERRLIDGFAQLAALAVQRLEYASAAEAAARRLGIVLEVAVDLAGSLDVGEVVSRLVRRAADAGNAERCVLLRVTGEETAVEDAYDALGLPDAAGYRSPIASQPLMEEAVRTGRPVRGGAYDIALLPELLRASLREVRHTLTLPLVVGGQTLAVLVMSRRREPAFGPGDVATLRLLGSVAVLALRNAWLFSEAAEASRAKSEFLNMAAHELRTPLTVLSGYLSMLADGSFGAAPEGWERPVSTLRAKTAELGELVEDILLTARLEAGRVSVRADAFDVRGEVRAAVRRALPAARRAGGQVRAETGAERLVVRADRELLRQVLDNLVANAVAYHRGAPSVAVRVARRRSRVRIEVEDQGRGIREEDRERIFERFSRIDDRRLGSPPGSGLGLHLSRELAARMEGELKLEWSRPGEGSRFVVTLPLARAKER